MLLLYQHTRLLAALLLLTPAAPFPQPSYIAPIKTVTIDVAHLVAMPTKPDFDKGVLIPLRAAQAETARLADLRAAEKAQKDLDDQRATNAARNVPAAPTAPTQTYNGSHEDWMSAAGISRNDYGYVDYI